MVNFINGAQCHFKSVMPFSKGFICFKILKERFAYYSKKQRIQKELLLARALHKSIEQKRDAEEDEEEALEITRALCSLDALIMQLIIENNRKRGTAGVRCYTKEPPQIEQMTKLLQRRYF